ncbi:hypothetical protein CEQ90_16455 [Lewinellaceae bacterium SD302]|nr:hypothetical protein CEQ90_16455 [Lewinellaceae bacterium SD302]
MANNWKLGLGLLAGAAAGYWLNTAEGRRFRQRAQGQLNEYSEQAGQYIAETTESVEKGFGQYVEQGKNLLEDGKQAAQQRKKSLKDNLVSGALNAADVAEEKVDSLSESLKSGIRKAKAKVPQNGNSNSELA